MKIRFLIDDASQCRTQQAVLFALAGALEERALGKVVRSSHLTELRKWDDVPLESSRRLALRLMALEPTHDLLTVFLPGHIVPGPINSVFQQSAALTTQEFTTVADLDLFTIDNTHRETHLLHEFVTANRDYESVSRYDSFNVTAPPRELISGGLTSALQLTYRPWYSAFAPTRLQWLGWVKQAIDMGLLDFAAVEKDAQDGLVRPSLLSDVRALLNGVKTPSIPDLTLDSTFVSPECSLTESQYRLLYSTKLQKRTVEYAKRNPVGKQGMLKYYLLRFPRRLLKYLLRFSRRLFRLGYQLTYMAYSGSVRPVVVWMRQKYGAPK